MNPASARDPLLLPVIILSVFLVGALGFGFWAFTSRQDYKDNVDQKVAQAVSTAKEELSAKKNAEFAEASKLPYTIYKGPGAYGSLTIPYPKTWSNYVDGQGNIPLNGYMQPSFVSASKDDTNYALRYQVVERNYDQEVKSYESKVKSGKVTVSAYRPPQQESILGVRVTGEVDSRKDGVLVILPLRDKIIKLWTEGAEFRADFEEILKQFTFAP